MKESIEGQQEGVDYNNVSHDANGKSCRISIMRPEIVETPASSSEMGEERWKLLLDEIGKNVRDDGHLVVIPTETVYGLGANALNRDAVLRIFEAKQRPLNDPVICHVSCYEDALPLFNCDSIEIAVIHLLAQCFWPGPLSIVARASSRVPSEVTANTGFVSARCPKNAIALDVIRASKVPIAAPSANRFGHISPSCSSHVVRNFETIRLRDFPSQTRLPILEGGACQIGIESTVCKVEHVTCNADETSSELQITILRRGFITKEMIHEAIRERVEKGLEGLSEKELKIIERARVAVSNRIIYIQDTKDSSSCSIVNGQRRMSEITIQTKSQCNMNEDENVQSTTTTSTPTTRASIVPFDCDQNSDNDHAPMCSPGMLLTHYSPSVPTYLCPLLPKSISATSTIQLPNNQQVQLNQCVVIDAFNQLQHSRQYVIGYFPLSESSDCTSLATIHQIISNVFQQLHNAEDLALRLKASVILVYDFKSEAQSIGEAGLAAYDRLFRSASGQSVSLSPQ